ncbi:MAG: hypothetical protein KDH17_10985 [Rhodocyclaceae bacterium]|nr:hypothetical protein [Rhodocyclaceae bacterium]MCP5233655.1 hypothetical protein [Zoogloeaceae bacterium]
MNQTDADPKPPRKTLAGEQEVWARTRGLDHVQRQLLIAADGRYSVAQLRAMAHAVGGSASDLEALIDEGLLTVAPPGAAAGISTATALATGRRSLLLARLHLMQSCPMIFGADMGPRELLATAETPSQLRAAIDVLTELAAQRNATAFFAGIRQVALHLLPATQSPAGPAHGR